MHSTQKNLELVIVMFQFAHCTGSLGLIIMTIWFSLQKKLWPVQHVVLTFSCWLLANQSNFFKFCLIWFCKPTDFICSGWLYKTVVCGACKNLIMLCITDILVAVLIKGFEIIAKSLDTCYSVFQWVFIFVLLVYSIACVIIVLR